MRIAGLLAVACAVLAAAAPAWAWPDDPNYAQGHEPWLSTIGWQFSPSDLTLAYPTIAVVDSGMQSTFPEFDDYLTPDSGSCLSGHWVPATDPSVVDDVDSPPHGTPSCCQYSLFQPKSLLTLAW